MFLIETAGEYDPERLRPFARPSTAAACLLGSPADFQILEVQNPHMRGGLGAVDPERAGQQWRGLGLALAELGLGLAGLSPRAGLSDLCFTANPSLAGVDLAGRPIAVLSWMRHPSRRPESLEHATWYAEAGYRVVDLWSGETATAPPVWEGGGDCLWHPGRYFLWAGHGQRSEEAAHRRVAEALGVPVALLRLVDPEFYHLDTCLALLDSESAAWVPAAFDDEGRALLRRAFPRLLEIDQEEARTRLAGNLYCPNQRDVLLPSRSPRTRGQLEEAGFRVREVLLDEFLLSGGSVFCLKQELPHPPRGPGHG